MFSSLPVVLTIFALAFVGWFVRRMGAWSSRATTELSRFLVHLALPALLFDIVATQIGLTSGSRAPWRPPSSGRGWSFYWQWCCGVTLRQGPQSGCFLSICSWGLVPRQELWQAWLGQPGQASNDVSEPSLGIDVVHLGGDDQRVHEAGAVAASLGAGQEPCPAAQGDAAQRPLGGIVREADAALSEEAGEARPTVLFDRVGDGLDSPRGKSRGRAWPCGPASLRRPGLRTCAFRGPGEARW